MAAVKRVRVSDSQLQALEDVERCGDPWARVFGQSQHGGWNGVMRVVQHERRWIRHTGKRWVLTAAGDVALRAERERRGLKCPRQGARARLTPR